MQEGGFMNLLKETIKELGYSKKTPDQVIWVGSKDGALALSWDEFSTIAKDINYSSGYGRSEVARDLIVVGPGWWLERWEYDGAEGWSYKEMPTKKVGRPYAKVLGPDWKSLKEINDE
jgi:hypothetical protein